MDRQSEYVLRQIADREVKFVRLWFTDVLGSLKSVAISPADVESAIQEGIGFDGSAIEGYTRVYEADMIAKPDPSTFQILPWRAEAVTARMFCDISLPDGAPAMADPRQVLKRALERAADMGFSCYLHPEIEFFLFEAPIGKGQAPVPLDEGSYFDHTMMGVGSAMRREAITMLEELGIPVEFSHHESAPGQHEIDLRYADALKMADDIVTTRIVLKELAVQHGVHATFMPKPLPDHPGSGMHTHISLFEGDRNVFHDAADEVRLSKLGKHFIAGLLTHAREITAITNQWVNSYKRLVWGGEAPSFVCWGRNNPSALVRVPLFKPDKASSARVEYRAIDPACNPYLAYAVLLNAGLDGIARELPLPPEAEEDVFALTPRERAMQGMAALPRNLEDAIELMEESELVAQTLGEHVFDFFLRNKRREFEAYRQQVTPIELATMLPRL